MKQFDLLQTLGCLEQRRTSSMKCRARSVTVCFYDAFLERKSWLCLFMFPDCYVVGIAMYETLSQFMIV